MIAWLDEQDETGLFIRVVNLGEIQKGIVKLRPVEPSRSQKLTAWLAQVEQHFAGHILTLDTAALYAWARLAAQADLSGNPLPVMDGLTMATAQCHGLIVVTRNTQDFGLFPQVFNPWGLSR